MINSLKEIDLIEWYIVAVLFGLLAAIIALSLQTNDEKEACLNAGGAWVKTGEVPIISRVNGVPVTNYVDVHECWEIKK